MQKNRILKTLQSKSVRKAGVLVATLLKSAIVPFSYETSLD
jgi:hypothetical protein